MKLLVALLLLFSHFALAQNWKGHKLSLLLGLSLIFLCFQANGRTTYTAIGIGNWISAGTWDANSVSSHGEAPLSTVPEATASAGMDALICYGDTYTLDATATNGTILWTTAGDGSFDNAILEDPVYTPGSGDISGGTVTLTITVTGGNTAVDEMVLTIDPEATAAAGLDAQICYNTTHTLAATAYSPTVWLSGYSFNKKITIDNTKVSGTANHTNFPVLISHTDADLKTTGNGGDVTDANGYDIVFTASDGTTLLDFQLEKHVATTGEYIAWVRIPSLDYNDDMDIYMYYGNPSVTTNQSSTDTWDANYKGIWHLDEATNSTNIDATSNSNNGTPEKSPTTAAGKVGASLDFNTGTTRTRIVIPADASLDLSVPAQWSISAWVKPTVAYASMDKWPTVYAYGKWRASLGLSVLEGNDGAVENWVNDNRKVFGTNTVSIGNWGYIVVTSAADSTRVYLNGAWEASIKRTDPNTGGQISYIGSPNGKDADFLGLIDEVRVSSTQRSGGWIATEFNNQDDPSGFYSLGGETENDILWTTSGDGTFDNATLEDPIYTPGSGDISGGTVTLTMTVTGNCNTPSDNMVLTIDPQATANAGPDDTVCYNASHTLAATATNGTILWSTSGDGTFDNATLEDPVYTPGSGDISGGTVTLTMTVTGNCNVPFDDMTLTIDPEATVAAGTDATICYNATHTLFATATNGTVLWTTSGDGTFDNDTLEDPVYTPGSGDISGGTVTLTMTFTGNCNVPFDDMTLTIDPAATAAAGTDATICYNATHTLFATATNGTVLWTTSGDGTFDNDTLEDPVYTPGSGDISGGTVTLTMTFTGNCNVPFDDMTLTIDPAATAAAGTDATICYNATHTLFATATNGTVLWTTSGDGTFDNDTLEDPVYTPGSGDISGGTVTLTMTVTGNCNIAPDDVVLTDDIEDPVISDCPADIVVSLSGAICDEVVNWVAPTPTDNCSVASFTSSHNPGDGFPLGTTVVSYIAIDPTGNSAICTFNVTVIDITLPTFDFCPTSATVATFDVASQTAVVTWQTPTAIDNCSVPIVTSNFSSGDGFPAGVTKVIYTATDGAGNTATCVFEVPVIGNNVPMASPLVIDAFTGEPKEFCLDVRDEDALIITEINYSTLNGVIDRPGSADNLCFIYTSFDDFEGEELIIFTVCDNGVPVACVKVQVRIKVTLDLRLKIYKAFTPDGDNINDFWVIENIRNYPNNQVMIYDRLGGLIYSARDYNNEDIVWDGRSNHNGQNILPTGTYFYKIDLGNEFPLQKGFIELVN